VCGRYVRRSDKQRIAEYFAVHGPSLPDFGPSWNVAPQTFQMERQEGRNGVADVYGDHNGPERSRPAHARPYAGDYP
jgi:hypothetical protein